MNQIKHVAIIMDGNGRWGIKQGKTRNFGHEKGIKTVEMIIKETRTHLLDPFTFHWKKSGFLPWSWKLIRIEHSKLEVPSGYVPGKSFNSLRW